MNLLQFTVAKVIAEAGLAVNDRKGLRNAMRVGVYRLGNRIFACLDGESAVEVKGGRILRPVRRRIDRYIRPENKLAMSFEFDGVPTETLEILLKMFREVAA
jgi:hypothetical protein